MVFRHLPLSGHNWARKAAIFSAALKSFCWQSSPTIVPCFIRPDEPIPGVDGSTFGDFWSWAYSDVLSNANRSVFAEYLVGSALGAINRPRVEWDGCDLLYRGKKIEVKASAYIQSWQQKRPSQIMFDVARHRAWDAVTNITASESARTADCYVFCVFADRDRDQCRVTDPSRWVFYPVATRLIDQHLSLQKTARLSSIERLRTPVLFQRLRTEIDRTLELGHGREVDGIIGAEPLALSKSKLQHDVRAAEEVEL